MGAFYAALLTGLVLMTGACYVQNSLRGLPRWEKWRRPTGLVLASGILLCLAAFLLLLPTSKASAATQQVTARAAVTHVRPPLSHRSLGSLVPLMPLQDSADISALRTGSSTARPLASQLQLLLEALLAEAAPGESEVLSLHVSYAYWLRPDASASAQIPILFQPAQTWNVPQDLSPGLACAQPQDPARVCQLAGQLRAWLAAHHPSSMAAAELRFDVSLYARDGAPPQQLRGVRLPLSQVSDL